MELGTTKTRTVTHAKPRPRPVADHLDGADDPIVDHDVLDALASVIGRDKVDQFISDFIRHAGMHRRHMRDALAEDDSEALFRSAHMLVAVSGSLGATQVSRQCDRMQRAAEVRDLVSARDMFTDVDKAIDRALHAMAETVSGKSAADQS